MQWGQIKSIFIISFLILNIFLLQQFMEKVNQTDYETLAQISLEEQLAAEEIAIGELPERGQREAYVSARRHQFSITEFEELGDAVDNQRINLLNNNEIILSEFIEAIELDLENDFERSVARIQNNILYSDQYILWDYYPFENVLLFFQQKGNHTIYFNESALLMVILDEDGNAVQYGQTFFGDESQQSDEETVVDPLVAIEVLYTNRSIVPNDEVTGMRMGYHTLVPLEGGVQVFAPTWEITVNKDRTYFVNAMEGLMIPNNEQGFVVRVKDYITEEIEQLIRSEIE